MAEGREELDRRYINKAIFKTDISRTDGHSEERSASSEATDMLTPEVN